MLTELGQERLSQIFLQRLQLKVKTLSDPLKCVLNLIYPNLVF
jgi:hypothetical protein